MCNLPNPVLTPWLTAFHMSTNILQNKASLPLANLFYCSYVKFNTLRNLHKENY